MAIVRDGGGWDRYAAAVHEAGHVVVAHAINPKNVLTAVVYDQPDRDGIGGYFDGVFYGSRFELAVVYLAGVEATRLVLGVTDGGVDDIADARRVLLWPARSLTGARRRADELVAAHEREIRGEAARLAGRREPDRSRRSRSARAR
jgi:hypothetical protein